MITPVHTKVPGRARFWVPGLYRNLDLKHLIEQRSRELQGITGISANILTGKILVLFHEDKDYQSVAVMIEAVIDKDPEKTPHPLPETRSAQRRAVSAFTL
ncbi:MAG: HMA2 domain-containing protein, partial [Desulfobacteraceae bacterium]